MINAAGRRKRVAIIGSVGVPAQYGGFETLAQHLAAQLGSQFEITIYCSSKSYVRRRDAYDGARLKYLPLKANGIQSIPYDIISMACALRFADVFLILGVSGCIALPFLRIITRRRIIVNVDGIEWKREKWNVLARNFLRFSERLACRFADAIVADNRSIQEYLGDEYGCKSELIEYGADHVIRQPMALALRSEHPVLAGEYACTVCRIEPENNIHLILEAFTQAKAMPVVVVGNWEDSEYGASLLAKFQGDERLCLLSPIYDQPKLNQIRSNCSVYIHGHSAGGTNPSLVEAMYLGLPVFAFDVEYNRETTEGKAIYFESVEQIKSLLLSVHGMDLEAVGDAMKHIAETRYVWDKVAKKYATLFD